MLCTWPAIRITTTDRIFLSALDAFCSRETSHVLSIYDPCAKNKKIKNRSRLSSDPAFTIDSILRGSPPKGELCLFVDLHPWSGERGEDARGKERSKQRLAAALQGSCCRKITGYCRRGT